MTTSEISGVLPVLIWVTLVISELNAMFDSIAKPMSGTRFVFEFLGFVGKLGYYAFMLFVLTETYNKLVTG